MHQGPYVNEPPFDVPDLTEAQWGDRPQGRKRDHHEWKQVRDGTWYAFYANTGPGSGWHNEHPTNPHWWQDSPSGYWACRHGVKYDPRKQACPDGTCGFGPDDQPFPSDEDVLAARLATRRLLNALERKEEDVEDPSHWGAAERIIAAVIRAHRERPPEYCGGSLPMTLVDALVKAGLMEEQEHPRHSHFGRDIQDDCEACQAIPEQAVAEYRKRAREGYTPTKEPVSD